MLLIFPPVAKACEPPAGIARLAGALRRHGLNCRLLDANLEGQLWLLEQSLTADDTWSRRAIKGRAGNLVALRDSSTYRTPDRYRRAVSDLNRILNRSAAAASGASAVVNLSDYQHTQLSPLRCSDLLTAASCPEQNPFYPYFSRRLPELLQGIGTVGFSLNYLSQALCSFAMVGYVRREFPGAKIVLGGGLVTSWMQCSDWSNPFGNLIDLMVCGAGEKPLLALCGITEERQLPALPDYSGLPLTEYLSPGLILPYSAADGCYWNGCSFCPERAEGNRYRPIPTKKVLSELQLLTAQTAPALIHLLDNAISPALLQALADNPPGAPWYGFARIDRHLAEPDFCRALRRSGCVMLKLGLESGDQGVLNRMGKGIDLETAARVLTALQQAGIAVYCYLLFGTPGETLSEARRTLEFVARHYQAITFLNLAVFNMPLCSAEAAEYGTELFYDGDLSLYTAFQHPDGWDRRQVRHFLEHEFKRHPAVAAIIRNDPPQFSSNHAPFFVRP
ncbi:MAG TPA: radical SAM protein [Desulfuromonadales bacterium]|nr:radical SAM protein [Desulfuromonadales bacterium]